MNPPDELVARLMRRYAPENYYIGANAVCFRTVRQVTLFGRCPLLMPTADFHNRYVLLLGVGVGVVLDGVEAREREGAGVENVPETKLIESGV